MSTIEKISGAILTSYINSHFLEEAKHTKMFKHRAKKNLTKTLQDLQEIEVKYFDEIERIDGSGLSEKIVANKMEFIEWLLSKYSYNHFTKIQEVCVAYSMDPARLTEVSDKILIENGAEQ